MDVQLWVGKLCLVFLREATSSAIHIAGCPANLVVMQP